MLNFRPTSNPTGTRAPGWSLHGKGNNRNLKVSIQIACYTAEAGVIATW